MGKHTAGRGASADPVVAAALAHRSPDRAGAHRSNGSSGTARGLGWPGPAPQGPPGTSAIGWPGSDGNSSSGDRADEDDETERVA